MESIRLSCNAKVNLFLRINGVLDSGYHHLSSVFQSVDLRDAVTIKKSGNKDIVISCSDKNIPTDESNIAYKAGKKLIDFLGVNHGYSIHIDKKIPSQAGLGGGSANGAAALVGINHMLGSPLTNNKLAELGVDIGADIPFCITGGSALITGIGDKLKPLPNIWKASHSFLIVKPAIDVNTKEAFARYDSNEKGITPSPQIDSFLLNWQKPDLAALGRQLYNVFEQVLTPSQQREIEEIKGVMITHGALGGVMSGSGSSVVGVFDNPDNLTKSHAYLSSLYSHIFIAKGASKGIEIIG